MNLRELAETATEHGWAVGSGAVSDVEQELSRLRRAAASERNGAERDSVLRPVDRQGAPRHSLNATFGTDAQPLHTEGAHQTDPPDFVVLVASAPSTTPTYVWLPTAFPKGTHDALRHGVFRIDDGGSSWLAVAHTGRRLRFDPGCMIPCDARSRAVVKFFADAIPHAFIHDWSTPDTVLVIDNRRATHARGKVEAPDRGHDIHRFGLRLETA